MRIARTIFFIATFTSMTMSLAGCYEDAGGNAPQAQSPAPAPKEGPITSMVTATALQLHARCTVIVDEEAGAKLKEQEYYRWIFDNEPEWESYR